jgi:hypothetical protein
MKTFPKIQSFDCGIPAWKPAPPIIEGKYRFDKWDEVTCVLTEPWSFHFNTPDLEFQLTLLPQFLTDGGSIPKPFWNLIPPYGSGIIAWLSHDGLYGTEGLPRWICDAMMLQVLNELNGMFIGRRYAAWSMVRSFGWRVWQKHTQASIDSKSPYVQLTILRATGEYECVKQYVPKYALPNWINLPANPTSKLMEHRPDPSIRVLREIISGGKTTASDIDRMIVTGGLSRGLKYS